MPKEGRGTPSRRSCLAVVLAAGEGTRMKSARPKVLHEIAGRSMLGHVMAAIAAAGATREAVVVGPGRDDVGAEARRFVPDAEIFVQGERLGTAHAVLAARAALERGADDVVIAFADTPLVEPATFERLRAPLADGATVVVLGFEAADPTGYGRLLDGQSRARRDPRGQGRLRGGASRSTLCNGGLMAIRGERALALLGAVGNRNAKGEYYLTDLAEIARAAGETVAVVVAPEAEVQGINDRAQLAEVEKRRPGAPAACGDARRRDADRARDGVLQPRHRDRAGRRRRAECGLRAGRQDRERRRDPRLLPSRRRDHRAPAPASARSRACGRARRSARRRRSATSSRSRTPRSAPAPRPTTSPISATRGSAPAPTSAPAPSPATTTASTSTAPRSAPGAFIGSNSSLVAPVTIGEGAYIGSGAVITEDVPADALALEPCPAGR